MPLLAQWIGGLFAGLTGWLGTWFARDIAIRIAIIAIFVTLTTGMIAGIYALFNSISYAMPSSLLISASWVVPTNAQACISAIVSAKVISWAYLWNVRILQFKAT